MKKILLCLLAAALALPARAQSKQVKVLLQQIAALKVYTDYAQKGYSIYKKGLNTIGEFKKGEFDLHSDYYTSLKMVNPAVMEYACIGQILILQENCTARIATASHQLEGDRFFYGDEKEYIKRVYDRLLEDCERILDELDALIKDNQLEMKDDERISRIDTLYNEMEDNYTFCVQFAREVRILSLSRAKEGNDVKTGRALGGINPN